MVVVAGDAERLVVSQGPSSGYRAVTAASLLFAFCVAVYVLTQVKTVGAPPLWSAGLLGLALFNTLALLRFWTHTEFRFDRKLGLLSVGHGGAGRVSHRRDLPFAAVSALVDRRSADRRAIELILADRSALVLAKERSSLADALDRVAREASRILKLPVELAPGAVLADRFEIDELIGRGGMGVVYRARDRRTAQDVAIKLIGLSAESTRRERFTRESRLLAHFDHPRIAKYVAHGETEAGHGFLAMQWLEGADLASVLADGPLSLSDSLRVVSGAAEALAAVHESAVIHRDLKPSNLFLRGRRPTDPVLLDFGIARGIESNTLLTGTKNLIGTPHYMAPEQASSQRDLTPAADVFALGCIFYECLTGRRAFAADQIFGVLARILHDDPSPIRNVRPSVPEAWASLIMRMLAKSPAARPPDGAALVAELALLPPAGDDAPISTLRPAVSERDAADQVLVCVVLAALTGDESSDEQNERLDTSKSAAQRFGCPIERLAARSLLATVLPKQSAVDQVRIAARCAMFLREQLPEARIALATGRAPLGSNARVGDAVDRAARLLEMSVDGDGVRLDEVSARLLDGRFATREDGVSSLLVGERPELDESRPLLGKPTPCVGRELELIQLQANLANAIEENAPKAAVVVGPPGSGKSRLRHELLRRLPLAHPGSALLIGYGDPLSAGSPYVLLGDALRRFAGIRLNDEPARARGLIENELCRRIQPEQRRRVSEFLGELMGVPFPAEESAPLAAARGDHRVMSEQISAAFADWVATECRAHPLLFVLEDLQWGDALTVKLLESALREQTAPLFVLALGRPEVEKAFPRLFGEHKALSLSLRPLSNKACEQLVRGVLGPELEQVAVTRIVSLAAGNALFLEELIRAAAEGKAGDVPESVLALLQGRLSRLAPQQRLVLRAASILGETFWRGGVASIGKAWGSEEPPDAWLAQLVETEIVAELRSSRFPGDVEYAFRHALVCDAANGLLTDEDRRAGHVAAGKWLEAVGETDHIVYARHAMEAGDRARALVCYTFAAERSLELYDFVQALERATRGLECGAEGEELGRLEFVQSAAYYSLGRWTDAADVGLSALERLSPGSRYWCSTVEQLMQVLPNVAAFESYEAIAERLRTTKPTPDAEPAYLRALCTQILGYGITGSHERGAACLRLISELVDIDTEPDIVARGYARLWRAAYDNIVGDDGPATLALAERAVADLEESQILYRLSLAEVIRGFCLWGLGEFEQSERAVRRGGTIAAQIHDSYHVCLADWYLGLTLSELDDPEKLEEADQCALTMVQRNVSPMFEPTARIIRARVAFAKQDWQRAESDGRHVRRSMPTLLPYTLMATPPLVYALIRQGRAEEAAHVAHEDLAALNKLQGPVCSEVAFLVAAAEAFFENGESAPAERTLRQALTRIDARAAKMSEPLTKETYLSRRSENRRARELAAERLRP
ncbi:MAG TPA: protein kinase [Polyangiaceae bacterium]|nr:protein kinase [Polyangiaceae bacterium]